MSLAVLCGSITLADRPNCWADVSLLGKAKLVFCPQLLFEMASVGQSVAWHWSEVGIQATFLAAWRHATAVWALGP